jgi:very-short-patch-repair endonuclease
VPGLKSNQRSAFKSGLAKHLRSSPTDAERRLWWLLRAKQLGGLRFRRQQPIGPYIVDFFCPAAKLIVELDGDHHGSDNKSGHDAIRTQWLEERVHKVLRFANGAVLREPILEMIWQEAQSRLPLPERPMAVRPSLKGRVE